MHDLRVLLRQLVLILLFVVECAAMVLRVTMFAAEHVIAFAREAKQPHLPFALPTQTFVRLLDTIHLAIFLLAHNLRFLFAFLHGLGLLEPFISHFIQASNDRSATCHCDICGFYLVVRIWGLGC